LHLVTVTAPAAAWAQPAQAPQPVPYPTLPAPVPYNQPVPSPGPLPSARGPNVGQDVIYMKNGGILRGTIIDAIPNSQARIQLATGEIATVPWQEIARIEHGETSRPAPPLPAPGSQPLPPQPPASSSATVWVHLDGPDDARLEQFKGDWVTACSAPCDIQLPVSSDYRVEGGGIRPSTVFQLTGNQGDHVTVTVNAGSTGWFVLGIVITPIGGLVALVGALVGLAGSVAASSPSNLDPNGARSVAAGGWTAFAIGGAALIGGILLIVNNAKTTTTQAVSAPQTGLLHTDAWKRVPTWREASPEEKALPPVVGVPLWTGRF
jgi:hypothetical protein